MLKFLEEAFWVYINGEIHKKPNLNQVVYNDFNRYMVNLFECCRTPTEFFENMKDLKAQDEKMFYKFQREIFKNEDISEIQLGDFEFAKKYIHHDSGFFWYKRRKSFKVY